MATGAASAWQADQRPHPQWRQVIALRRGRVCDPVAPNTSLDQSAGRCREYPGKHWAAKHAPHGQPGTPGQDYGILWCCPISLPAIRHKPWSVARTPRCIRRRRMVVIVCGPKATLPNSRQSPAGSVCRHLGNVEQPQNWDPALGPFFAVRNMRSLPQRGGVSPDPPFWGSRRAPVAPRAPGR